MSPSGVFPGGGLTRAAVPVPAAEPDPPTAPAKVVPPPAASIFRITWFFVSATKRSPVVVTATAFGESKRTGSEAEPSKKPGPPAAPARAATDCAPPAASVSPHPDGARAQARKI